MTIDVTIHRQKKPADAPYTETYRYEGDGNLSVADFLTELNESPNRRTVAGKETSPIQWECSCQEKKCGACAMVVNGRPTLACGVFLREAGKKGRVTIEPLRKFPLVCDLVVDRASMFALLRDLRVWGAERKEASLANEAATDKELAFKAGQCLLCGCCLEVCPNFLASNTSAAGAVAENTFAGPAFMANLFKAATQSASKAAQSGQKQDALIEAYRTHFLTHCSQSLSCAHVCPAAVPLDALQARLNHH